MAVLYFVTPKPDHNIKIMLLGQLNHHNIGVLTYPESEEEADFYANSAKAIWQGIPGVIAWLKKNAVLSLF